MSWAALARGITRWAPPRRVGPIPTVALLPPPRPTAIVALRGPLPPTVILVTLLGPHPPAAVVVAILGPVPPVALRGPRPTAIVALLGPVPPTAFVCYIVLATLPMDRPVAFDAIHDGDPMALDVIANGVPAQTTQTPWAVRI